MPICPQNQVLFFAAVQPLTDFEIFAIGKAIAVDMNWGISLLGLSVLFENSDTDQIYGNVFVDYCNETASCDPEIVGKTLNQEILRLKFFQR